MMLFYSEKFVKDRLVKITEEFAENNLKETVIMLDSLAGGSKELESYYLVFSYKFDVNVIELRLGAETIASIPVVSVKDKLEVAKVTIQILDYLKSK